MIDQEHLLLRGVLKDRSLLIPLLGGDLRDAVIQMVLDEQETAAHIAEVFGCPDAAHAIRQHSTEFSRKWRESSNQTRVPINGHRNAALALL